MDDEEQSTLELLQRYRRDRHVLLSFILSGSLIKKVVLPPGAVSLDDIDLDRVSIDYVLNHARKGETLDLAEAIRVYYDDLEYPSVHHTDSVGEFFLVTNSDSSGSPPRRPPPAVPTIVSSPIVPSLPKSQSLLCSPQHELTMDGIDGFDEDIDDEEEVVSRRQLSDSADLSLDLPSFISGISDDDLRETAYEILLACAGAAGGLIVPAKEKKKEKKEKKTKLMRKFGRSKSENPVQQSQNVSGLVGLLETMRVQLEISESMDIRTRQGLLNALVDKMGKRMDTLLIPLELLCSVSRTEFSDKKTFLRWQKRQLNMLEEGLINHPVVGFGESARQANDLRILLKKIKESELLAPSAGDIQITESLRSLREITTTLAERPARGDLTGEICHWADGYHLNVKLYEKMLSSIFDILDEGSLTEEVEKILELLKSTWRILGITETIHTTCYAWVLFRQYVITGEPEILKLAIKQLQRIPLKEQRGPKERLHLKSLCHVVEGKDGSRELTFLQSFLSPIKKWSDKKLGDYHLNFSEGTTMMAEILAAAVIAQKLLLEESDQMMQSFHDPEKDQIELYIISSIKSLFSRVVHDIEVGVESSHKHMLASLACDLKIKLKKEKTMYLPILSKWHPKAPVVSASVLHRLYGNKLRPFLEHAEYLTEDVVSVFPAADSLEQYIMTVISSACEEELVGDYCREKLTPYQVETVSGTLVLRWVNSQVSRIIGWVERAIQQERWVPISPQQRHGNSIVEVYRFMEETVDQFFDLKVPMRIGELISLLKGLDSAFQVYTKHITEKIVNKEDLVPPLPALTRYRKEVGIKSFIKKDAPDYTLPDAQKSSQINVLSTKTLCVRLNALHYAVTELNKLEDSIQDRWTKKKQNEISNPKQSMDDKRKALASNRYAFDGTRKDMNAAIDNICDFMGTKIIFWDMRDSFLENLYRHSVSQSRLETIIEALDAILNELCDIIVEPLRDRVVTALLQASLGGLMRVLLDGGPSRIFFPSDAKLLNDDLEILKEFFISGGDGLPRGSVENLVSSLRPVIDLHSYETRVLIDDLKYASQGSRSRFGADAETLLRILCHRPDSEASQFLKKQYKIPKTAA